MNYTTYNNFDLNPTIEVNGQIILDGKNNLINIIKNEINIGNRIFAFECYCNLHRELFDFIDVFDDKIIINTRDFKLGDKEIRDMLSDEITDDRVFGFYTSHKLEDCFESNFKDKIKRIINENSQKTIFIIGVGASMFYESDINIFFDITRWDIQLAYRNNGSNWLFDTANEPQLEKYKIGYFIEWRMVDEYKYNDLNKYAYFVDASKENIKIISNETYREFLQKAATVPFRLKPYFDASVWGGQWMKNKFALDNSSKNYGWSFDGVAEENSIQFKSNGLVYTMQGMNLVKVHPKELLGNRVYEMFGAEFPIRFDLLDTYEGGNLSLQVHPLKSYIREKFGMEYTQDESYYILDATKDSCVYLGVKDGVDKEAMLEDFIKANRGEKNFDAEKYTNRIAVKKHDHISIPAGTVHCSGKDTLVLEISATPYIFTFKLWDWGRVGLDGIPRPVHLEHGFNNIQFDRNTKWVNDNLLYQESNEIGSSGILIEKTGLHELEFIETIRYTIKTEFIFKLDDSVAVGNLVEGECISIESINEDFTPFEIHYGETFIIPAKLSNVKLIPKNECKIIIATVRR